MLGREKALLVFLQLPQELLFHRSELRVLAWEMAAHDPSQLEAGSKLVYANSALSALQCGVFVDVASYLH
jgi:hypothetical protein